MSTRSTLILPVSDGKAIIAGADDDVKHRSNNNRNAEQKNETSVDIRSTNCNQTVRLKVDSYLAVTRKTPKKKMTRIKSKSVLRIEFLDSTKEQIVLANYLRGKDAKGQILAATTTQLYPYALAEQDGVDPQDVEFAFERSIADLEKQIKVMRRYKQIKLGHNSADSSQPEPPLAQNQMSKKSVNFVVDEEDEDSNSENLNFSVRRFNDN